VHQFGTKDGTVPARRFLPFDENGDISDSLKDGTIDLIISHITPESFT
jgi:phage gpG-like protein